MEGQDLSVLFEGKSPEPRRHFTLGYHDHVRTQDGRYAMISLYDGSAAKLYDLREDPRMKNDIAAMRPGLVKSMFDSYVLKDAGGPLPHY